MAVHVVPENDEREHVLTLDCWCEPRVIWIDPDTNLPWAGNGPHVTHHAADCRETSEEITGEQVEPGKGWGIVEP